MLDAADISLRALEYQTMMRAEDMQRDAAASAKWASVAIDCLFVFGWVLGLGAKIAGDDRGEETLNAA